MVMGYFWKRNRPPVLRVFWDVNKISNKKCTINSGVVPRGGAGAFPVQSYGNHIIHIVGSICLFGLESYWGWGQKINIGSVYEVTHVDVRALYLSKYEGNCNKVPR